MSGVTKTSLLARAWGLWLDCWTQEKIAKEIGVPQQTISDWITEFETNSIFGKPPGFSEKTPWGDSPTKGLPVGLLASP